MKTLRWVAVLALLAPVAAAAAEEGVPLPRGWIGTTSDWLRGLGIAFALLNLVLLAFAWRSLRPGEVTPTARGWLFVAVGLLLGGAVLADLRTMGHAARSGTDSRKVER